MIAAFFRYCLKRFALRRHYIHEWIFCPVRLLLFIIKTNRNRATIDWLSAAAVRADSSCVRSVRFCGRTFTYRPITVFVLFANASPITRAIRKGSKPKERKHDEENICIDSAGCRAAYGLLPARRGAAGLFRRRPGRCGPGGHGRTLYPQLLSHVRRRFQSQRPEPGWPLECQ